MDSVIKVMMTMIQICTAEEAVLSSDCSNEPSGYIQGRKLLINWAIIKFCRRTLTHGVAGAVAVAVVVVAVAVAVPVAVAVAVSVAVAVVVMIITATAVWLVKDLLVCLNYGFVSVKVTEL
jgi:VIT1/CCC1 family predicted Fe2+/Mn2+ transporter